MTTFCEKAYAKLNLTLDVLGKREDGYHDLKSVMQTVSIQDDIEIDIGTGDEWRLYCSAGEIPSDPTNLAWKAARVFCDFVKKDPGGITIRITKRIPSGAGMGGGSADAAAVLRILNRYYGNPLTLAELADLGAKIGSDVPFCVLCGTAMAEGRGEKLRSLAGMPECCIAVCKPEFSVSTPELYRKIDTVQIEKHPDNDGMEDALSAGNLYSVAELIYNVFDPVVAAEHREIMDIKAVFESFGALASQMTGSGSAVFAIMPDREAANRALLLLKEKYGSVFIANPV